MMNKYKFVPYPAFILGMSAVILLLITSLGCTARQIRAFKGSPPSAEELYDQAVGIIEMNYIDDEGRAIKVNTSKRPDIDSLMSQLDKRSALITRKELEVLANPFAADLGIRIESRKDQLYIIGSIKGSPADRAGISIGYRIVEINGMPVEGLPFSKFFALLKGESGSEVSLKIVGANSETKVINLLREVIKEESLAEVSMIRGKVGYIRLRKFDDKISTKLQSAIKKLKKDGMKCLILDLRGNGGGLLQSVIDTSQLFLNSGKMILQIKGSDLQKDRNFYASWWTRYLDFPMVILIDRYTGRGAEMFAAALRDNQRVHLVGENTLGSASIYALFNLDDDFLLYIRTHFAYSANGQKIDEIGLLPDIEVKISEEELNRLYREVIFNEKMIVDADIEDKQLNGGVSYLLKQIESTSRGTGGKEDIADSVSRPEGLP
ncbi:MAG: hypothetical protein A2X87_07900 [Deltaproteobacteria bacterium GWC2_42_51]|nr:MAG: hypothetical protein A2056_00775 [Deltaproteobacteria bacterium GWA2_42_85]OGP31114.1 MAG: hypothetical protein A2X87_07900 [Deltaproteobacteria bacterium GWC2_42_51]